MINTLLVTPEDKTFHTLKNHLNTYCPQIHIAGTASSLDEACQLIQTQSPELVFLEIIGGDEYDIFEHCTSDFEVIVVSPSRISTKETLHATERGCLFKPVQVEALIMAVQQAQHWILLKQQQLEISSKLQRLSHQYPPDNLIGIPDMDGIVFLKAGEIVRCEALQRFTRVVTIDGANIISSYNIGQFSKLLSCFGFFSPHKSHLINLLHLRKFHVEGTIHMRDGSTVPVSRRRRSTFLKRIKHL